MKIVNYKGYIIGSVLGASLMFSAQSFGASTVEQIKAVLKTDLKITVNGQTAKLDNPAINFNGSNYLKLTDAAKLTGSGIVYNAKTQTVEMSVGAENIKTNLPEQVNPSPAPTPHISPLPMNTPEPTPNATNSPKSNNELYELKQGFKSFIVLKRELYYLADAPVIYQDTDGKLFTSNLQTLLSIYANEYLIDSTTAIDPEKGKISGTIKAKQNNTFVGYTPKNIHFYNSIPLISLEEEFSTLGIPISFIIIPQISIVYDIGK